MSAASQRIFAEVTKHADVRDRLIRAFHRHAHDFGYLWEPEPACGCEYRIDCMLSDYDDEPAQRDLVAVAQRHGVVIGSGEIEDACDDCGRDDGTHNPDVEH